MWEREWQGLSQRATRWSATAEVLLPHLRQVVESSARSDFQGPAARALCHEVLEIFKRIDALRLQVPDALRKKLDEIQERLGPLMKVTKDLEGTDGVHTIPYRLVALAALRSPLDEALATTEEPRRRLVERAFLHLNRTLTVDDDTQRRWRDAFSLPRGEERCEKLGALHLLSHGIYSFKADADSGITDLILGMPLAVTDDVRSTEALVLTEWKLVRDGDDPAAKALEGRAQADRYASVELAGIELRSHRYVVLVSMHPVRIPPDEQHQNVTTHYVNVVIDPPSPSVQARQAARSADLT